MLKNSYKTQFLQQLNHEQLPLNDRLHMAFGAIISQHFPLPSKEQIIIDWFATCLQENKLLSIDILKMIRKTLSCDWLATFSEPIDPSNLIQAFEHIGENHRSKYSKSVVTCLLLLLQNPGFQRFCRFDIQPMCQATILTCHLMRSTVRPSAEGSLEVSVSENDDDFVKTGLIRLFESVHNIYTVTQQRSELKLCFVKLILPVLLKLKYNFHQCTIFQNLFEELVFCEDLTLVCEAFKSETPRKIQAHLKALVTLMTNDAQQCDLVILNPLLFDVYVQSYLKSSKSDPHYIPLFYILTSVAGFRLQLPYITVTNSHLVDSQQLSVLTELIGVLQKQNIPVSSESAEGVLSTTLIAIEKQLLSDDCCISIELLRTLQNIFNVYPESVRLVFSEFAQHIVFVEKSDSKIIKCYSNLLVSVIKTFSDLNQLHKFFALFSHKCVLAWKENRLEKLTIEMILTDGFFTILSDKLPSLTGNQLKTIIGRMEKNFSTDFVSLFESNCLTDANFNLFLGLIVKVLCHVLENAYIVMPTRWNILGEEMKTLALSVQRFGVVALGSLKVEPLLGFLQLVRVVNDIELALKHYTISLATEELIPRVESKDKSCSVHNLSKTHGFLPAPGWKQISDFVEDSYHDQLKHCWFDLLVQKYIRLSDLEVVTHLTLNADGNWLWGSLTKLAGTVPLNHLELYTDHLLATDTLSTGDFADKLAALRNIEVFSNRPFRAALNVQVLKHMSGAVPEKTALSRNLVKLIDVHSVLKYEAEVLQSERPLEIIAMTDALAEVINKCHWGNNPVALRQGVKDHLVRLIDLITILSPHCLNTETKRMICLTLMGLAYDLRGEDIMVQSVLEILIGCLDGGGSVFPDALNRHVLVYWLVTMVPSGFLLRHELTRLAVTKVIHSLDKCVDSISQVAQGDRELLCTMLETLIQAHGNKSLKNKEEFQKLVKVLIAMASSVFGRKDKEKFLRLYTVALKAEFVFFKDKAPALLPKLSCYLNFLFRRFADNSVVEPNATELIDLTLNLKPQIEADITKNVYANITRELCKIDFCPILCYPTTLRAFFESLSSEDFENAISEICKHQQKMLTSDTAGVATISNVCELWSIAVSVHVDRDKAYVRQKLLSRTLSQCHTLLERDSSGINPAVIKLLHIISVSKSITLSQKVLDLILVTLEQVPTDTESHMLPECLSVLDSLINVRPELIFDRIPAFLQRLRKFIKSLVLSASADTGETMAFNSVSTASVNHVTRIMKTITDQHSKHFARISPYLIADMLHFLVSYSIESSIKSELQNCVCILLTICDHLGNQLLQSLLPLPATELFKVLSTTFNKSYKYTGKV